MPNELSAAGNPLPSDRTPGAPSPAAYHSRKDPG